MIHDYINEVLIFWIDDITGLKIKANSCCKIDRIFWSNSVTHWHKIFLFLLFQLRKFYDGLRPCILIRYGLTKYLLASEKYGYQFSEFNYSFSLIWLQGIMDQEQVTRLLGLQNTTTWYLLVGAQNMGIAWRCRQWAGRSTFSAQAKTFYLRVRK